MAHLNKTLREFEPSPIPPHPHSANSLHFPSESIREREWEIEKKYIDRENLLGL